MILILITTQLIINTADDYPLVSTAPAFSIDWRFGTFAADIWGLGNVGSAWNGTVHCNLNRVAFVSNLTDNPEMCIILPEVCAPRSQGR